MTKSPQKLRTQVPLKSFNPLASKDEEEVAAKKRVVVKRAEVDDGGENGPFCK